jgi:transposase InsO family protein
VFELAKHTRSNYPSVGERSKTPFEVVHSDVWGPSAVTSLSGDRWYVIFIDGFSRCTWLYLLKHKSKVLSVFKDFYNMVHNQYNVNVKVLCSDNGTEYINKEFDSLLSAKGIIRQTTCVHTAEHNGVAERKNMHLLEVVRSLIFLTNFPTLFFTLMFQSFFGKNL